MYYVKFDVKGDVTIGVDGEIHSDEREAVAEATKIFEHYIRVDLANATLGNLDYKYKYMWYVSDDDDE